MQLFENFTFSVCLLFCYVSQLETCLRKNFQLKIVTTRLLSRGMYYCVCRVTVLVWPLTIRLFRVCVEQRSIPVTICSQLRCFKVSTNWVTDCTLPNNNVIIRFFAAARSPFLRWLNQRETASSEIRDCDITFVRTHLNMIASLSTWY